MMTSPNTPSSLIAKLRTCMKREKIDAWIEVSSDPHLSSYVPEHWRGMNALSGFSGSTGWLVVTAEWAGLWVDSRYWGQAERELAGSGIEMMKLQPGADLPYIQYLSQTLAENAVVAMNGAVVSMNQARKIEEMLAKRELIFQTHGDLLPDVWETRPPVPNAPIYAHAPTYAMGTCAQKLSDIREAMREKGAQWHAFSTLDDIAHTLNLRGSDIPCNPVFVSHLLVGENAATLFVMTEKISAELVKTLANDGVAIAPYDAIFDALGQLQDETIWIDPQRFSIRLRQCFTSSMHVFEAANYMAITKSRKTPEAWAHIRETMVLDGAALCRFFSALEMALGDPSQSIMELDIHARVTAEREKHESFVSPSFNTISAFNENAALPHYSASLDANAVIEGNGLLLIDSGGQYWGGTTDITRVMPVGEISNAQKSDFTLVLKGLIALSSASFPQGIPAPMLDAIARAPIWSESLDYGHGTGHGVGYFLSVHEGPQSISYRAPVNAAMAMEVGMVTSIEPGIYRPQAWGIRIENLVLNQAADKNEFGTFLRFETLTLCPIDTRCINSALLSEAEVAWLNAYHEEVRMRLMPHVDGDAAAWLQTRTMPI